MTKINKIVLHGFKSFARKTDIILNDNFNCVIGPNGSGKSNVMDAICFVLGRLSSKSMRAERTANLIFNGGKSHSPADKAEVQIYFDNTSRTFPVDADEVKVSRTVTLKGNSTYRVNDQVHTRTEMIDVLSAAKIDPNGFNIVLQGDITHFIEMSVNERRGIIEEISGISIYEDKKRKALLELEGTNRKLGDAEIILQERQTHLKELKKDRDQAIKFKTLKDNINSNKATFTHLCIGEEQEKLNAIESQVSDYQSRFSKAQGAITELKRELDAKREKIILINGEIEEKGEKEQVEMNRNITELRIQLTKDKSRLTNIKDEISKLKLRCEQLNSDLKEYQGKVAQIKEKEQRLAEFGRKKEKELEEITQKISQFKKKHKIDDHSDMEREVFGIDRQVDEFQDKVNDLRVKNHDLIRKKDQLLYQLNMYEESRKKLKEIEKEHKVKLDELRAKKEKFKRAAVELNRTLDNETTLSAQLNNAKKNIFMIEEKLAKTMVKHAAMMEKISSDKALSRILNLKKQGVYGTAAQLGSVSTQYSKALEIAAGGRINSIVVDSDKTAAECISYLKKERIGIVSFIPLNRIKTHPIESKSIVKEEGVVGFAIDLIDVDPRYKKAFSFIFGSTLVLENMDSARKLGIGKVRMVTLDGDLIESSGMMRGGFIKRTHGAFADKDAITKTEHIESEIADQQALISSLQAKKETSEEMVTSLRTQKHELEGEIIAMEKSLHIESRELDVDKDKKDAVEKELERVGEIMCKEQAEISSVNRQLTDLKIKRQQLRENLVRLKDPRTMAQLKAFDEMAQQCRKKIEQIDMDIKNGSIQINEMILPEQGKMNQILKQHEKEQLDFNEEIKVLSKKIGEEESNLRKKEEVSKVFFTKFKSLFNERDRISQESQKIEAGIEAKRDVSRRNEMEINKYSLRVAELRARLAGLNVELERYKDAPLLDVKDKHQIKKEIDKFELMMINMSAVNMKALEIYDEVEREYNSLIEKKKQLDKEKIDVLELMNEIETKKKSLFMDTYNEINEHFKKFFSTLSKKGNAYLELENLNNPFEGGLHVKVRLTGRRYLDIKSLSGGEKTLTALAFIFSVQEYSPHTFYIFDEVDAALDKYNSEKLAQLIKAYSARAQYLVISHNDALITEADVLYGASMTHEGISKIMSIEV